MKPAISVFGKSRKTEHLCFAIFFNDAFDIICLLKLPVLFYPLRLEFNAKRLDKSKESGYVIRF